MVLVRSRDGKARCRPLMLPVRTHLPTAEQRILALVVVATVGRMAVVHSRRALIGATPALCPIPGSPVSVLELLAPPQDFRIQVFSIV